MRRLIAAALALTVIAPLVLAYAASFSVSYEGSAVFVVPVEDVVTEQVGGPAVAAATVPVAPAVEEPTPETACSGTSSTGCLVIVSTPGPKPATPTPTPRPLPKQQQLPKLGGPVR